MDSSSGTLVNLVMSERVTRHRFEASLSRRAMHAFRPRIATGIVPATLRGGILYQFRTINRRSARRVGMDRHGSTSIGTACIAVSCIRFMMPIGPHIIKFK